MAIEWIEGFESFGTTLGSNIISKLLQKYPDTTAAWLVPVLTAIQSGYKVV